MGEIEAIRQPFRYILRPRAHTKYMGTTPGAGERSTSRPPTPLGIDHGSYLLIYFRAVRNHDNSHGVLHAGRAAPKSVHVFCMALCSKRLTGRFNLSHMYSFGLTVELFELPIVPLVNYVGK